MLVTESLLRTVLAYDRTLQQF